MKKIELALKIFTNITTIAYGISLVGGNIALENAGAITAFLGQSTQEIINDDNSDEDADTLYFKSKYESIKELNEKTYELISKVTEEGAVLLKNDNNALPLSSNAKVNLYSSSSVNFIYSGGGSSLAKKSSFISLKEGLEKAGLVINNDLWNWYESNSQFFGDHTTNTSSDAAKYSINDAMWSEIGTDAKSNEAEAGIFVLSRYGTEATDLKNSDGGVDGDYSNGNYLELSPSEKDVLSNLKSLKEQGKIKKIILLLNSVNQVQCDYLDDYDIDAILWVGEGGTAGTIGIGKILSGEVNPSGKITDTYWKEHYYNPVYANFGDYKNQGLVLNTSNGGKSNKYVVYQEGIYNGYRYVETRYEDTVLNRNRVGDFTYNDVVAYPFGYGLSYTNFEYSDFNVSYNQINDVYDISLKVTNTGNVAGKESVEIYLQKPYTDYDVDNGIEKSSVDFVGYDKTSLLEPNTSEIVSLSVDGRELASYDSHKAKTYILDEGNYYFTVGKNSNDAVNNILAAKKAEGTSVDIAKMTGSGNKDLVKKFTKEFDDIKYSISKVTKSEITNQFDDVDLNLYKNRGDNKVTYISRNNWNDTVKLGLTEDNEKLNNYVKVTVNEQMIQDSKKGSEKIEKDDVEYPTYGAENNLTLASMLTVVDGKMQTLSYNDENWDLLLDQLTWDDYVMLLSNGLRKTNGIDHIGKPITIDGNGALCPVGGTTNSFGDNEQAALNRYAFLYDDPDKDESPAQFPCASLLGASLNDDLAYDIGEMIGETCLWCGYSGLYGLGLNIHRGAYNGRGFEYFSEDGILNGKIAASEVKGIRSKGVYVYMKHAILNDQEKNREGVNTWANEQSIREIYAKPFQIAIEEGGAENIMTGFNRLGVTWTSQQGFLNNVFRKEFGMIGFAVSDYWQGGYMDLVGAILGGCALPDGDTANSVEKSSLNKYKIGYGKLANAMREEAHRILYIVGNSNAMNGVDANTRFRTITPPWIKVMSGVQIGISVLFYISLVGYIAIIVINRFNLFKRKEK